MQFSVRLPPPLKLGLEMISEQEGLSYSQALEFVLTKYLRTYKFGGQRAIDIIEKIYQDSENLGHGEMYLRRISVLPEKYRSEEQKFMLAVFQKIEPPSEAVKLTQALDKLAKWFRTGISADEAVKRITEAGPDWFAFSVRDLF